MKRARATHIFVTKKDRERDNRMKKTEDDNIEEATSEETLRGSVLKMVDSAITDTEEIELKKIKPLRRKKEKETDQPRRDIYVVPGRIALKVPDEEPGPSTSFRADTIPEESSKIKGSERRIGERKVEKRNAVEDLKEKLIDVKRKKNLLDIASRCNKNDSDPKKGKKKGRQSNRKRSIFCYHELGTRLRIHFDDEEDTGEDTEIDKEVDELKIQGQEEEVEEWIDDKTLDKTVKDIPSRSGNLKETRPSLDMFKKYGGIPKKSFENLTKKDFEIVNPDDENFEDVIYSPAPRVKNKKLERKKKEKSPVVRELKDVFLRDTPTESIEELEEIEEIDTDPQIFFNYSSEESGNSMQLQEINLDNQNEMTFSENLLEYPIEPTPSEESDSIHTLQRHEVACSSSTVRKIEKSLESTNVFRDRSSCLYLEDILEYPREEDLEDNSTDMESSMHKLWEIATSAPFDSRIIRPQTVLIQSSHGATDYTAQRDYSELIDNENTTNKITGHTADTAEELNITQQQNVTFGSPALQVCSNSNKNEPIETSYSLNQLCCDSRTVTETVDGKYTGTDINITGTDLTNPVIIQQSAIVGSNEKLSLNEIDVKVGKGKTGSCFVDITEITGKQIKSQPKIAASGSKTVIKHSREKFRLKTGSQNLKIKSSDLEIITQPKSLSDLPDNQNTATDKIDNIRPDKLDAVGTPRKSKFSLDDQIPSTSKCSAACVGRSSKESKRPLRVCKSLLTSAMFGSDGRDILSEEVLLRDIDMEQCLSAINKAKIEITTATREEIAVATLGGNRAEFIQTHEYREEGTNPAEMNVVTSIHSVLRPTCSKIKRCDNRRRMKGRPRWTFANKTKLNNFIYYKAPILREPKRDVFYRVPPSIDKSIQYDAPEIDIEDIFCSEKVVAFSPKEKSRKRKKENKVNRWIAIWEGIQCRKVIDYDYEDKYEDDRYKVCDGAIVDNKGNRLFVKKDSFMMKDIKRLCECAYEKGKSALKVIYTDIKSDSEEKNESVIYNSKTQIDRSDESSSRGWGSNKKEKRSTWKNMLGKVTKGKKYDQCQAKKLIKNLMGVNYLEIERGKPDPPPKSSEDLEVVHKILPKCTKANQSNLENTASNANLKGMEAIGVFRAELKEAQDNVEDDTLSNFPFKFRKRFLKRYNKNLEGTSVEEVNKGYKKHSSLEKLAGEKEGLQTKKERKRLSTAFRYKTRIICGRAFSLRNTSTDFINWMRRPRPRPPKYPESPLAQEIADVSESPSSQESERKDVDPEEVEGRREDVATGFFQDGRRVDYVLVLNNSDPHEVQNIKLDLLTAMARVGLEMEAEFGKLPETERYHFVKIYTPGAVLKKYGCVFNVLKYFRENHLKYINNSSMSSLFRTKHEREVLKEIRKHYQRPLVLSNHDRSYITYMLLRQIRFGLPENFYGFSRLLENKIVVKGFALHDGPYLMSENWQYRKYNARQLLFLHWGRYFLCSLRAQPLHIINEYFGSKLGFYFVFCEFYNRALAYAAIWGIFMFIAYTMKFPEYLDYTQYHMCKKPRSDFLIHLETVPNASIKYPLNYEYDYKGGQVCAECEPSDPPGRKLVSNDNRTRCPYQKLSNICPDLRLMQFFDNPYITVYSLGISVWALLFQRLWKRTEAFYSWMWEESVCPPLAVPRVEHKKKYTSTKPETCREKCNTFFLDIGRGSVTGVLVPAIILLLTVLLTLVFFMYLYIDLSKPLSISKQLNDYFMMIYKPYDYLFLVLWTLLLLTLLCILEQICHFIALKLVNFENHRFQEDYESSLLQKVFSYSFVLMAAPTVYFAWIKGSFYYSPTESFTKFRLETWWRNYSINQSDFSRRLISQNCNPFSCFRQAVVVFITTVVFRFGIVAVIRDSFKRSRHEPQWKKDEEPTTIEREFLMPAATTDVNVLFDTNALMVQFGIITMFAPLCPLAPVVALLVNLLHVKMKSRDLTMNSKRPILYKVKGIGAWNFIIKLICWGTPLFHALTVIRTEIFRRYLTYKTNVDLPNEWGRNNPMHREYKFARMLFLGRFNISMARQRGSKHFSYSSSILETMTNCSLDSFIYRPTNQTRNNTQWPFQPMLMDERWTDSAPLPVHYYSRYLKVAYVLGFMLGAALLGLVLWQHLPSPAPAVARRRYRERTLRRLHCPRLRFTEDDREVHAQAR